MGTLDNSTLSGMITQCSAKNNSLVVNCSIPAVWTTPFNATVSDTQINGNYRGEYWTYNISANGTWSNCTRDHYTNDTFSISRMDCALKTFAQLADKYISDPTKAAEEIALSNQLESGVKVVWTAAQSATGGLQGRVTDFQSALLSRGITSTVLSAYRPVVYQAHFADIKSCIFQMLKTVLSTPVDAQYLSASVTAVNQEVTKHAFEDPLIYNVHGLEFDVPDNVCSTPPFTQCAHVNQRAVDLKLSDPVSADWIGAMYGFCRPVRGDGNHWEYSSTDPWSNPRCSAAGVGPGNAGINLIGHSPINLLVTSPSGQRIGFDPSTGADVNDFGNDGAIYSGAGTDPQVIDIPSNVTELGNYSVSGVGTGSGPYTITYSVVNPGGEGALATWNETGTASLGAAITPTRYPLRADYSIPSPWTSGVPSAPVSGSTSYTLQIPNGTFLVSVTSSAVRALMFAAQGHAIALRPTGLGGLTTVTIPHQLLLGPFTVRADGTILPSSTADSGSSSTVSFQMPTSATVVTIDGKLSISGPARASSFPLLTLILILLVAVSVTLVAAAILIRRRHRRPPPLLPLPTPHPPNT